jgi:DNA modification methylase
MKIFEGDCIEKMRTLADHSVDAIVTDPPYHLTPTRRASKGFMGQTWDGGDVAFRVATWAEALRVLKPGGHLLAFSAPRTYHRMAVAIEDAGFEIRDQLQWLYGSGFPKSHDISKAVDKSRADEDIVPIRQVCRFVRAAMDQQGLKSRHLVHHFGGCDPRLIDHWAARDSDSQPSLPTPEQWQTLKRILSLSDEMDGRVERLNARKGQYSDTWNNAEVLGQHEGVPGGLGGQRFSVRDNKIRQLTDAAREWQGWGTALKPACEPICLARKPLSEKSIAANVLKWGTGAINIDGCRVGANGKGRWPANIIHDGSDEAIAGFPTTGKSTGGRIGNAGGGAVQNLPVGAHAKGDPGFGDEGTAARYFYCAKANKKERRNSKHPTVKPIALMRYLCRLTTPPGGTVLDPFAGTGTTGEAALLEGFIPILIERDETYIMDIHQRLAEVVGEIEAREQCTRVQKKTSIGTSQPDL